jgi:hypothetical protein
MVRGSDSLVERFFELSTGMRVSEWKVEVGVMGHTLGTNVVVQPFCRKSPWVQTVLKAVDDERLASDNDMEKDELLEGGDTLLVNLVDRDAIDKGEVWRRLYKAVDVEVGRDRLEGRARSLCGHFCGCCVWRTLRKGRDDMRDPRSSRMRMSGTAKKTCERWARAPQ